MIVYIVTREETGRPFVVFSPFFSLEKARALVEAQTSFRISKGATPHRSISFTPCPVVPGTKVRVGGSENHPVSVAAPECVNCVINEVEIIEEQNRRVIYRVTQHDVM